jgi:hypothetical protein
MEFKEVHELPMHSRLAKQSADASIRSLVDAAVELITNADDSYRRLEEQGVKVDGKIEVFVSRQKGGMCKDFWVKDCAEGMTREKLGKAIVFGGETSGFETGRTVRGLFGRGLKESIIALGEGEVHTIKNDTFNAAKIWWDEKERKAKYALSDEVQKTPQELRSIMGIEVGNGTVIKIRVKNERIRVPECDKLTEQIASHYALRGIASSDKRKVSLAFQGYERRRNVKRVNINISFEPPEGKVVYEREERLPRYGDSIRIKILESPVPLESPRLNPFAKAGILIKTEASILDSRLFSYENEPAAFYLFGEAYCVGMSEKIRQGETGIIDFNRGGIEWHHEYCRAIEDTIEKVLEPLVQEKKRELEEGKEKKEVAGPTRKILKKLCALLNELAKKEFEEWQSSIEPAGTIDELAILPRYAYIEADKPRSFGVYAPLELVRLAGNSVTLWTDNVNIQLLPQHINLDERSKKHPNLRYGVFKVIGRVNEEEADIYCDLGDQKAITHVKVHPLSKKHKKGGGAKGGFIRDIVPDPTPNPPQRVEYKEDTATIKVYTKFPVVANYFGEHLEKAETEQGKVILAELVGEAFCRVLAMRKLGSAEAPSIPGREIESFNVAVNDLQKKYLHRIHGLIANWRFK